MISAPSVPRVNLSVFFLVGMIFLAVAASCPMPAQAEPEAATPVPPSITTPDSVDTRIGTLEFKDGAPSAATAEKVYDTLDFTRALDAFLNSYGGASAYAIRQGLLSIGAEDNSITIYPELMDSKSLFLTANADPAALWR